MKVLATLAVLAVVVSLAFCNTKAGDDPDKNFLAVPREVQKDGKDFAGEDNDDSTVAAFSDFSWRSFVALNWPATDWPKQPQRGVADTTRAFSDANGPRVWETWKANYEIIPKQPAGGAVAVPKRWNTVDDPTPAGGTTGTFPKVLGSNTLYGDISQAMMVSIPGGAKGPLGSPLVCQNSTYTHFEVRMNRVEFASVRGEGFYLRGVIDAHIAESGDGAAKPTPFEFPHGSITVKAAWRELLPTDVASTFYTTKAKVLDYKTGLAADRTLGLVGLHIVQKTPLRAQWVWSSFEHATNAPGLVTAPAKYSYNDGTTAALADAPLPVGVPNPYVSPTPDTALLKPAQVVRNSVIHPQSVAANKKFHALLPAASVWKNYHLVLTQWPTKPSAPADEAANVLEGRPFPPEPPDSTGFTVSNMTMETWTQFISCIGCHETAEKAGFDYVFFPAMHAESPPGAVLPLTSPSLRFSEGVRKKLQSASERSKKMLDPSK